MPRLKVSNIETQLVTKNDSPFAWSMQRIDTRFVLCDTNCFLRYMIQKVVPPQQHMKGSVVNTKYFDIPAKTNSHVYCLAFPIDDILMFFIVYYIVSFPSCEVDGLQLLKRLEPGLSDIRGSTRIVPTIGGGFRLCIDIVGLYAIFSHMNIGKEFSTVFGVDFETFFHHNILNEVNPHEFGRWSIGINGQSATKNDLRKIIRKIDVRLKVISDFIRTKSVDLSCKEGISMILASQNALQSCMDCIKERDSTEKTKKNTTIPQITAENVGAEDFYSDISNTEVQSDHESLSFTMEKTDILTQTDVSADIEKKMLDIVTNDISASAQQYLLELPDESDNDVTKKMYEKDTSDEENQSAIPTQVDPSPVDPSPQEIPKTDIGSTVRKRKRSGKIARQSSICKRIRKNDSNTSLVQVVSHQFNENMQIPSSSRHSIPSSIPKKTIDLLSEKGLVDFIPGGIIAHWKKFFNLPDDVADAMWRKYYM